MKRSIGIVMVLMMACAACDGGAGDIPAQREGREARTYRIFNEGLALSLEGDALADTNWSMAVASYRKAIARFRDVLAIDSTHFPATASLAHTLYASRRDEEAIEYYDRALALRPDFAAAYHERGMSYLSLGWEHQAEASIRRARELDSSDEYRRMAAHELAMVGNRYFDIGSNARNDSLRSAMWRHAVFALTFASELVPDDDRLASTISGIYRAMGDRSSAERFERDRSAALRGRSAATR